MTETLDIATAHAVIDHGTGAPAIVLAHGIGGSVRHWDRVVERLVDTHRVIRFSLAGSAECDERVFSLSRHSSIVGFAEDLADVVDAVDGRGALYVGHSMSAMAGLLASIDDPGLFGRIVALNGSARYIDDPHTDYVGGFSADQVDALLVAASDRYVEWATAFAHGAVANPDQPEHATEFARTLAVMPPAVAVSTFRAAFTSDFRDRMPLVPVPTLVVQSADDPAVPMAAAEWLAQAIPMAELLPLSSTGHFPHLVDPEAVVGVIERALAAMAAE